jgi:sugar transferase EpsL
MYSAFGKRAIDLILSVSALVLLSPVLIVAAILVRIKIGSPVLFRHQRPGLGGRPFTLLKFRTMTNERDAAGELLPDEQRLTSFGKFLRSSSIDELPELLNVVRNDMSLVGPRPLLMQYLELYTPEQMRRHDAKPGITGLAQVSGRNLLTWEEKFEMDVRYVDNLSFALDLKILFLTVWKVLRREGISEQGHVTMSNFAGTAKKE